MMHTPSDTSSSEIPARRSQSDPAITPREHQRVGTPYPIPKKEISVKPSVFHPGQVDPCEFSRSKLTIQSPHIRPKPKVLKTEFYPSHPSYWSQNSPEYPHPGGVPSKPGDFEYSTTPLGTRTPTAQISTSRNRAQVICRGVEKLSGPTPSSTTSVSGHQSRGKCIRTTTPTAILDAEGYIQGPHTSHNRHIQSPQGKQLKESIPSVHFFDQERGDFDPNKSKENLPPLPPHVKSRHSKLRLTTATISNSQLQSGHSLKGVLKTSSFEGQNYLPPQSALKRQTTRVLINSSSTSIRPKIQEVETCAELHRRLQSASESTVQGHTCPLCAESKGQCHLHHRTMCSRYLTDLEWRICNAVNIYVYKNGEEGQTPILIHIPPAKKKNMRGVMSVIQERICYPIGYAKYLYRMNGKIVTSACELEMYNNYVVASNYEKVFKCVCYARRRSPLLVLAKESKHVRELRLRNYQYELYLARKRAEEEERPNLYPTNSNPYYTPDPIDPPPKMTVGQPGPRASVPLCSSKTNSKRTQRSVVVPALEQMSSKNCPYNPGKYDEDCRDDSNWFPQNGLSRNPGSSFTRNVTTPLTNGRPPSRDYQGTKNPPPSATMNSGGRSVNEILEMEDERVGSSGRYKGIINDDESPFYSSTKKKVNRGVIDVSARAKKIFYQESDPLLSPKNSNTPASQKTHTESHDQFFPPSFPYKDRPLSSYPRKENSAHPSNNCQVDLNSKSHDPNPMVVRKMGDRGSWGESGNGENPHFNTSTGGMTETQSPRKPKGQRSPNLDRYPCSQFPPFQPDVIVEDDILSSPSRSYTVVNQGGREILKNCDTPVTALLSKAQQQQDDLSGFKPHLKDVTNCPQNNGDFHPPLKVKQVIQYQDPNPVLYTPPSIYLSRNQTSYACYTSPNDYFVQPTPSQLSQAQPIQQIYPVEILTQRPPFGHMTVDSNLSSGGHFGNCYSTTATEIDIPFTPLYQRGVAMEHTPVGPYIQVPQTFVRATAPGLNQQFSYLGNLQGYNSTNGAGIRGKKPTRRNVAVQMGESISNSKSTGWVQAQQNFHPSNNYGGSHVVSGDQTENEGQWEEVENCGGQGRQENEQGGFSPRIVPPPTQYKDWEGVRGVSRDGTLFEHRSSSNFSKGNEGRRREVKGEGGPPIASQINEYHRHARFK